MQPLFADQSFSDFINSRLGQMKAEIEKLKCADVEHLNDAQLRTKADTFAEKYLAKDIPQLDRLALEKSVNESSGQKYLVLPFSGSEKYFKYVPSVQAKVLYVDKIEHNRLFVIVEDSVSTPAGEAEEKAEIILNSIEASLTRMQDDADTLFSAKKITESAEQILRRKRDSCAKLRAGGYSVR